ncbi:MAG: YgeY family selenium metabolism-linked hydrolase, partial [Bacteroidetes bacterium]|nr:YgeY family selenium metabolism-linked hydrolase [Bacteroidota bacterium]
MKETANKIQQLSEQYRDYTADNLSRLVKIKSISGGEGAVQEELKRQLLKAGVDEVFMDGLGNVIGRLGNGSKKLVFDGHID